MFIELNRPDAPMTLSDTILVNFALATTVIPEADGNGTLIRFVNGDGVKVPNDYDDIRDLIKALNAPTEY